MARIKTLLQLVKELDEEYGDNIGGYDFSSRHFNEPKNPFYTTLIDITCAEDRFCSDALQVGGYELAFLR